MNERLLTRGEVIELINDELGIPVRMSTLEKSAMRGTGPTPVAKFGRSLLYERESALEWARGLIAPAAA